MTLFLCHACSNIDSPSGEACVITAPKDRKHEIIGNSFCLRKYTRPITEKERNESSLILPDKWDFDTDFYLIESNEAYKNYKHVLCSPLWDVLFLQVRPLSNEEMLWRNAEDQIYYFKRSVRAATLKEHKFNDALNEANSFMEAAKPCTLEEDPITQRWVR